MRRTSSPARNQLILLVEDTDDVREMYTEYLELRGYRVAMAASGPEAIAIAKGPERPALMLLDLRMPGMDGLQVLRTLREDPELASMPIVAFTSYAVEEQPEILGAEGGFDAVISKPCLPDELFRQINKLLRLQR